MTNLIIIRASTFNHLLHGIILITVTQSCNTKIPATTKLLFKSKQIATSKSLQVLYKEILDVSLHGLIVRILVLPIKF